MKKYMKSSTAHIKKIVVKCLDWTETYDIDSNIFNDVYMEAATRAIETKNKLTETFKIAIIMDCCEEKNIKVPNKHFIYNTYFVLVNAGLHNKAEMLRLNFQKLHGIDLQKESIRGDDDNGGKQPPTTPLN